MDRCVNLFVFVEFFVTLSQIMPIGGHISCRCVVLTSFEDLEKLIYLIKDSSKH